MDLNNCIGIIVDFNFLRIVFSDSGRKVSIFSFWFLVLKIVLCLEIEFVYWGVIRIFCILMIVVNIGILKCIKFVIYFEYKYNFKLL